MLKRSGSSSVRDQRPNLNSSALAIRALKGRAAHLANRRGERCTTSHLILTLVQEVKSARELFSHFGIGESDLVREGSLFKKESEVVFPRVVERAERLYSADGELEMPILQAILVEKTARGRALLQNTMPDFLKFEAFCQAHFSPLPSEKEDANPAHRTLEDLRAMQTEIRSQIGARYAKSKPVSSAIPSARRNTSSARNRIVGKMKSANNHSEASDLVKIQGEDLGLRLQPIELHPKKFPTLFSSTRNLSIGARDGILDPVVGRSREIEQVLDVLAKRRGNFPVLVGRSGVGKSAVAHGLAHHFLNQEGKEASQIVLQLQTAQLLAGTAVRGAFAERMHLLKEELARGSNQIILVIDDLHLLMIGEGADSPFSELSQLFERGDLRVVGVMDEDAYARLGDEFPSLGRHLTKVHVDEPSEEHTKTILADVLPRYAHHHEVSYSDSAIEMAVKLTRRFIIDRALPEKAIAVLDQAGARARRRGATSVDRKEIANIVSRMTSIEPDRLLERDRDRLLRLEESLNHSVVGHEEKLSKIADSLRKAALLPSRGRPLGTFLLLGPTGVGKTETAKAISNVFFPGAPITRIDMSELNDRHGTARLLGAPPGYIGFDAGGQLTESVRRRPHQLILLDEIEKAHTEVLMTLLPLLDEGRLTDNQGRTVDFTNTVIVMTSNLGAEEMTKRTVGFSSQRDVAAEVLKSARKSLPPELWNRIDEPMFFSSLSVDEVREIASRMLDSLAEDLQENRNAELKFTEEVVEFLLERGGFDELLGARPMKRTVSTLVAAPIARLLLEKPKTRKIKVEVANDHLEFLSEI